MCHRLDSEVHVGNFLPPEIPFTVFARHAQRVRAVATA